jgi:hypothetical protein
MGLACLPIIFVAYCFLSVIREPEHSILLLFYFYYILSPSYYGSCYQYSKVVKHHCP